MAIDIEAAISSKIRASVADLAQNCSAHEALVQGAYPYAVVKPVTETPQYSSKGRLYTGDLIQVAIYARTAAQANALKRSIDQVLSDQELLLDDDYVARIWLEQSVFFDPQPGTQGSRVHERAMNFRCVRRKIS